MPASLLLSSILVWGTACPEPPGEDLSFLALLALGRPPAGTGTTGGAGIAPLYEFSEVSGTYQLTYSNFYGAGQTGYYRYFSTSVGPNNPTLIVQGEQEHASGTAYIDFRQTGTSPTTSVLYSRNNVSAGGKKNTFMHFYGTDTSLFTGPTPYAFSYGSTQSMWIDIVGPASGLPITYRRVRSQIPATSEENSFAPDTVTADHKLRGMSKTWTTEKQMKFHLIFLAGSNPAASESGIAAAITKLTTAYTQNTVRIRPVITSETFSAAAYLDLTSLSQEVTTPGSLGGLFVNTAAAQKADAVNVIFVKNSTANAGVLGISGGIPGLPGKTGTRSSAMVVIFDSHLGTPGTAPNATEQALMGETIAHEAGHWLGLYHLVESNYAGTQNAFNRDAITETPRCTGAGVTLLNCDSTSENNSGARNVMFWAGQAGWAQPDLTGEQGWLLRRHPLAY